MWEQEASQEWYHWLAAVQIFSSPPLSWPGSAASSVPPDGVFVSLLSAALPPPAVFSPLPLPPALSLAAAVVPSPF